MGKKNGKLTIVDTNTHPDIGRPGVCIAQNGPGITNFVTGVAAAFWAHSPVVVITPETGSLTQVGSGWWRRVT